MMPRKLRPLAASAALAMLLGACAGPVAERAFDEVGAITEQRIGQRAVWIRTDEDASAVRETLDRLLGQPLTADAAVQIALLNNRRLQAGFSELGIGAADLTSSWRPANPGFSFARLRRGDETEIERSVTIEPLSLLLLPLTSAIESRRFEATKLRTATDILSLAAQTKQAWYKAVAAAQSAHYIAQVRDTAEAQVELARRMTQVGNFSALDYAREQLFHASATAQLAKARLAETAAREKLARLMGLWGSDLSYKLPDRLPDLPPAPRMAENIEAEAVSGRLDIQMARTELAGLRRSSGLTNATRFINILELGYQENSETGRPDQRGYEIGFEIPIFDFGDAKATRAEQAYMQAVNRLADTAIRARSSAREAYLGYRTAYDVAQHYQAQIIPLRRKIGEEMMLRYNGMLVSVFELLSDARDQIADVNAALEAQRDFWIADTELTYATIAPVERSAIASAGARMPSRLAGAGH